MCARRVLPVVVQQRYDAAKGKFDRREFAAATAGFCDVLRLMADPDLDQGRSSFADLKTLAEGFRDLSSIASAPAEPPATAVPAAASEPATLPSLPSVFDAADADTVPPIVLKQALPPFPVQWGVARAGVLELVIDERGLVESVVMRVAMHPRYDRLVVDAARSWRYRPATRDGVPVKYRKMVQINVRRSAEAAR